ncbi:hypothetical protein EVC45_39115 [Paraburkholderia sp. UYCP14C]|uniref:hypothetical protein n=1 Tax=Paraburkholderia sp. UYCP14C TaxID=2511130 RepID=UPI0010216240|nr:hypothetical protein [Paraburkholderia sp. UYCP14C]RZF24392.1 hypothetical protein EVC45_39115 [Paraburkholderia sp. UYCP14C]
MLLAALNIPFDEELCDTKVFTSRIDAEVATQEFDILVLPSQPYLVSPRTYERRTRMEQSTRALIRWLADLSARKHALIVCGTLEPARKQVLCRTALVAFNGRLIARHVKFPEGKNPGPSTSITKYMTAVDLPYVVQQASILLDEDLWCPIPLVAVSRSCMCLVSCLSTNTRLLDRARTVAVEFGIFVVLSTYGNVGREIAACRSTILTPAGNEIFEEASSQSLLISAIPDVFSWTETKSRRDYEFKVRRQSDADGWMSIGCDPLNERSGFYVP